MSTVFSLAIATLFLSYGRIHHKVYSANKQLQLSGAGRIDYTNKQRLIQKVKQHRKFLQCMLVIVVLTIAGALPVGLAAWLVNSDGTISPSALYFNGHNVDNQFQQ